MPIRSRSMWRPNDDDFALRFGDPVGDRILRYYAVEISFAVHLWFSSPPGVEQRTDSAAVPCLAAG